MAGTTYPEAPFSFTHKSGKGYDATMLTIRGLTADEFKANAEAIFGEDLWEDIIEGHLHVPQDVVVNTPAPTNPGSTPAPQAASQSQGQPDMQAAAPTCPHGTMEYRKWIGKSGPNKDKDQHTYFCPLPREVDRSQKCSPVDAITGKSWGG